MPIRLLLLLPLALGACDSKDAAPGKAEAPPAAPGRLGAIKGAKAPSAADAARVAKAPPEGEIALPDAQVAANVHPHTVKRLDGSMQALSAYKGKALLIVNTASECGFTPQYEALQTLYATYRDRGFEVLAFPSNDYGGQEPGTPEQIRKFVDENYKVEFPMFDKVATKGPDKVPLYKTLTEQTGSSMQGEVEWNFTKFLIDPAGKVVQRFASDVSPTDPTLTAAIERVLPQGT